MSFLKEENSFIYFTICPFKLYNNHLLQIHYIWTHVYTITIIFFLQSKCSSNSTVPVMVFWPECSAAPGWRRIPNFLKSPFLWVRSFFLNTNCRLSAQWSLLWAVILPKKCSNCWWCPFARHPILKWFVVVKCYPYEKI